MKAISLIVALGALILCVSCTSIPEPRSEEDTVVVFPMEYVDAGPGPFYADYHFFAQRKGQLFAKIIQVSTRKRFNSYRQLSPAAYRIVKAREVDRETGETVSATLLHDVNFVLTGGKITIFPYMVKVILRANRDPEKTRSGAQKISFERLTADQYETILRELTEAGTNPALIAGSDVAGKR